MAPNRASFPMFEIETEVFRRFIPSNVGICPLEKTQLTRFQPMRDEKVNKWIDK
jgi:hypothetical protein